MLELSKLVLYKMQVYCLISIKFVLRGPFSNIYFVFFCFNLHLLSFKFVLLFIIFLVILVINVIFVEFQIDIKSMAQF